MEVIIQHDGLDHSVEYLVAQGNDGSDVITFTLPRYRGSLDLSTLTPALLLMQEGGDPDEIRVADDGYLTMETADETVTLRWTLSSNITAQAGALYYQLVFRNADEDKRYSTFPAKLTVVSSLDAEELLVSSYPTYLWQWEQEMAALKQQTEETLSGVIAASTSLERTKSENGFLFNVYANGTVLQRGRTGATTAQTFEDVTIGSDGDVSLLPDDAPLTMEVGEYEGIGSGILIQWADDSRTRCFPALQVRRDTPEGYGSIGLDVCNCRQSEFSFTMKVYACSATALNNSVYDIGEITVTVPNDGEVHHIRYTWEQLGAAETPYLPQDGALCCQLSWNNASDTAVADDWVWLSNVDCYIGEV